MSSSTTSPRRHWPAADRRDADKIYNPMTISELTKLAPRFPLGRVLRGGGHPDNVAEGRAHGDRGGELRLPEARRGVRRDAGRGVARLSDGPLPAQLRRLSAQADRRRGFRLLRHGARRARPQQLDRATRAACSCSTTSWAKRSASSMSPSISRRTPRPRPTRSSPTCCKAYDADIHTLDWMTPATRAEGARQAARTSRRRSAIPTSGATIRRLPSRATIWSATSNAQRVRVEPRARRASTSRSTAPNGA